MMIAMQTFRGNASTVLLIPVLAMVLGLAAQTAVADPGGGGGIPHCGSLVAKIQSSRFVGKDNIGDCGTGYNIYHRYQQLIWEDQFQNGSKYYCGDWTLVGCTTTFVESFPSCMTNTCTAGSDEECEGGCE